MPKPKHTFQARHRNGTTVETPYEPIVVISGSEAHTLALHKKPDGAWAVSHPASGAAVVREIAGSYRGVPCSSRGWDLKRALQAAVESVDLLIATVGTSRFNRVLANPKPF